MSASEKLRPPAPASPSKETAKAQGTVAAASGPRKGEIVVSQRLLIPLSALMCLFAIFPVIEYAGNRGAPDYDQLRKQFQNAPLFLGLREADGVPFMAKRVKSPIHYIVLHALPALAWSIIFPLQHWRKLRRSRPQVHRMLGYAAFSMSFLLAISGLTFGLRRPKLAYSHDDYFHVHRLDLSLALPFTKQRLPLPLAWGTFEAALPVVAAPYLVTMARALHAAAVERDYTQHQRWAASHTIFAYAIHVQRVAQGFFIVSVAHLALARPKLMHRLLRFPDLAARYAHLDDPAARAKAMSEIEVAGFAASAWIAVVVASAWWVHAWHRAGRPVMRLWGKASKKV